MASDDDDNLAPPKRAIAETDKACAERNAENLFNELDLCSGPNGITITPENRTQLLIRGLAFMQALSKYLDD